MSQENVEIVRRFWDDWNRGDLAEALEALSEDVTTWAVGLDGGVYHGKEGYLEILSDWNERFSEWTVKADEFIDAGECVVVRNHQIGLGEVSEAPVESDFWFVYTLSGGKIVRQEYYTERQQAFEAAGLST